MPWLSSLMMEAKLTTAVTVSASVRLALDCGYLRFSVWSNFEIGSLELWRGEPYSKFFDFLDSKGGFYYEVSDPGSYKVSQFLRYHLSRRDGVMHPSIVSAPLFLPRRSKS
jgi:hypothetical protein